MYSWFVISFSDIANADKVTLITGASFWIVVPPIVKVSTGISLKIMLLGNVEPVCSIIVGASSSLLQEMKHNHIHNEMIVCLGFLIYVSLLTNLFDKYETRKNNHIFKLRSSFGFVSKSFSSRIGRALLIY